MKKIFIASTSYIPKNKAIFKDEFFEIKIGEYGGWAQEFAKEKSDAKALVLILEDLGLNLDLEIDAQLDKLSPFIEYLKLWRLSSNDPLLILFGSSLSTFNAVDIVMHAQLRYNNRAKLIQALNMACSENTYVLDMDQCGLGGSIYSSRNWYAARCRMSNDGLKQIKKLTEEIFTRHFNARKKLLILDCDNTIWGGVIGEDGLDGIKLGQDGEGKIFEDFQRVACDLGKNGVLIALASKNNEEDVINVLSSHKSARLDMNKIVAYKINWKEKYINIEELAIELDLGLNSFVFWDDNPVERGKLRKMLPDVKVVEPPFEISEWPQYLKELFEFKSFSITAEDLKKNDHYKSRMSFVNAKRSVIDIDQYLKSIKLSPRLVAISDQNIDRAVQLTAKTNQFNVRTIRSNKDDLRLLNDKIIGSASLYSLMDIYGDHGIVGLFMLRKISPTELFVENLLMSCRVLGRDLDCWVINEIINIAKNNFFKKVVANYIPSPRNSITQNIFIHNGFKSVRYIPEWGNSDVADIGVFYSVEVESFIYHKKGLFQ